VKINLAGKERIATTKFAPDNKTPIQNRIKFDER